MKWIMVAVQLQVREKTNWWILSVCCVSSFYFANFSALLVPFHLSVYLSFTVMVCLRSAHSSWGDFRQTADCCSGHGKTQPSPGKQNTGQWITASKEPHNFILTSTAPDMMVFVLPGHQGLENCSPSLHTHTYRKTHTYAQLVLHFTLSSTTTQSKLIWDAQIIKQLTSMKHKPNDEMKCVSTSDNNPPHIKTWSWYISNMLIQ